jgi:hypothetical protein
MRTFRSFVGLFLFCALLDGAAFAQKKPLPQNYIQQNKGRRPAQVSATLTRDLFFEELKTELERSYYPMIKQRAQRKIQADREVAFNFDPWTLTQSLKDTSKSTASPRYDELLATTNLKYEKPSGLKFETYVDFFQPTEMGIGSSRYSKNNYGFSVSQNLIDLFKKNSRQLTIELVDYQSRQTLLNKDKAYLGHVLNVVDWSYALFSSICKKVDLEKTIKSVEGTLAVGQVQRSARTISTTELLRIRTTYLNIKKQIDAIHKQIALAQSRFLQISDNAYARAVDLTKAPIQCEENIEAMKAIPVPDENEMDAMIKKHPAMLELSMSREIVKKQMESYHHSRNLKLNASLGYDKINNIPAIAPAYDQIYVALTLTYQFKDRLFDSQNKVYHEQFHAIGIDQKIEEQLLAQTLDDLVKTIRYNQMQIPLIQDSINNASQLLRIIETQQSIGQLDASAIDSAYQAQLTALSDMRDVGDAIFKATTKMGEIKSATIGGRLEKEKELDL